MPLGVRLPVALPMQAGYRQVRESSQITALLPLYSQAHITFWTIWIIWVLSLTARFTNTELSWFPAGTWPQPGQGVELVPQCSWATLYPPAFRCPRKPISPQWLFPPPGLGTWWPPSAYRPSSSLMYLQVTNKEADTLPCMEGSILLWAPSFPWAVEHSPEAQGSRMLAARCFCSPWRRKSHRVLSTGAHAEPKAWPVPNSWRYQHRSQERERGWSWNLCSKSPSPFIRLCNSIKMRKSFISSYKLTFNVKTLPRAPGWLS